MMAVNAVLFDRDHTLTIDDPPYNGDPDLVRPMPGAVEAVARLRTAGIPVGVVTNQAGIGLGLLTHEQVEKVNARVDEVVGPFDTWQYCPHAPADECSCRKPAPGLILRAADALGVDARTVVVIGDTVMDVGAAESAGATGILVLTDRTRASEMRRSRLVCRDLLSAVDWVLAGQWVMPA
ncbi:MAG TPA: HAD-IIIA family hydrolase [Actinomycetota bacterium]|jgi:D-glycero-D-manno-heptose 1,7-bisphosphate phosphatase|nr:HAD-IIIA family hydrolase [Actinomycetota bacterium]